MNQENRAPLNDFNHERLSFLTFRKKFESNDENQASETPKRPLLSRDRGPDMHVEVSPLSDRNSRPVKSKRSPLPPSPLASVNNGQSPVSVVENCMFIISPPQTYRKTVIDDEEDNTYVPAYIHRKAKPAPATTWKTSFPQPKSSKPNVGSSTSSPIIVQNSSTPVVSFQPAIRPRVPFNLTSTNTFDKQAHAYTIWFNSLFAPVEFIGSNTTTITNQSIATDLSTTKTLKSLAESSRWYILRDRARELFTRDIQGIATKISADIDIDNCRINPKTDLNFSTRTVSRQSLLNFISSYNRVWFRLALEVLFPINIENYQQMKLAIEQYLIQSNVGTSSPSNDSGVKKNNLNNKTASAQIRLTIKNLILIIIFLERAKLLRLIDNDPCLYVRESKFKSTKESIDVLSRDFISSDTNLIRRLKLAGFEPTYRQTSLDEYNYLIATTENKLFDDLKDGIRLTRCAQILLSSTNEQVARFDLSTKLKCPVVNLVHKLLNIDQAFELLQTYGHVNLTGISNKDIMNGNKQRTLELLWRIFTICYLPKYLSPIERLQDEVSTLTDNLSKYNVRSIEQQLLAADINLLQKQQIEYTPLIQLLIKWAQLICAHYKFWLYDLQESFIDGRAFLYIISYYLPSICDSTRDIKHLTTLATCQTRDEHIQFNLELSQQQPQLINTYERNVKSNFRLLEECVKQFGTFSNDLIKYEYYSKDIPDERYTIIVLSMLAHDLIFSNNINTDIDFRHQPIFEELKDKYSFDDDESIIETKKEESKNERMNNSYQSNDLSQITDINSVYEDVQLPTTPKLPKINALKPTVSSTTIDFSIEELSNKIHSLPLIPAEDILDDAEIKDNVDNIIVVDNDDANENNNDNDYNDDDDDDDDDEDRTENTEQNVTQLTTLSPQSPGKQDWSFVEPPAVVYDQTLSDSLYASLETMFTYHTPPRTMKSTLSQSIVHTMNNDILDHLETLPESTNESDGENEDEDSFDSARSGPTATAEQRQDAQSLESFRNFVEVDKTADQEETQTPADSTSLFLVDEIASDADSTEMNKLDDASFADPVNTKMIKETLTLFLAHQHQTLENEDSLVSNSQSLGQTQCEQQSVLIVKSEAEREYHAAQIVQACWRGRTVRCENQRNNHPVVDILERIRAYDPTISASVTLRERMMQIVQEYSESSSSSLTAYLHFLRDIEPIISCCLEIRYLIAQQGLLRLFFILMRCCNRSGPSAVLLTKVLSILELFTVKRGLIIPLIDKPEQVKDFIMLLLKYYQQNRNELFEHICSLLESIVADDHARKLLRSNKSFMDAIEYVYKRVFNKSQAEDEKYRQQVRSTPKQSTGPQTRRATLLNQSSILYPTPKMVRQPVIQNENIFKRNLVALERFMTTFYRD